MTDSHKTIPCLGQRGQKPYSLQRHIPVLYRLYKGVLINLGEEPSKRLSEAAGSVFWVSLPALPGDTGPNYCDRRKQLTTVSYVEAACVAGAWKYLGSRKTWRAKGLSGRRPLSPRVSPSRVPFFLAPTTSKRLLHGLC